MTPTIPMVSVGLARERARKKYDQHFARWAASPPDEAVFDLPLHPPTETAALEQGDHSIAWVRSWRDADPGGVLWERRRWVNLGAQDLPLRLTLGTPDELARFSGRAPHWRTIQARAANLREQWGSGPDVTEAIRRHARTIAELDAPDFTRLEAALGWLATNPSSGLYIRQLPVRGVDTKWISAHRGMVTSLFMAITGHADLGLATPPALIRVCFLDPALRPGGMRSVAAPATALAELKITPRTVFVFENLESVVAMPDVDGAVVMHGSGYAVDRLKDIPWARDGRIIYWGDLDTHGFAILDRIRSHCADVTSVLMDPNTLEEHRDLWVSEEKPSVAALTRLTSVENETLAIIRGARGIRLEQERIPWQRCLDVLLAADLIKPEGPPSSGY